jgi:hypothetical protein
LAKSSNLNWPGDQEIRSKVKREPNRTLLRRVSLALRLVYIAGFSLARNAFALRQSPNLYSSGMEWMLPVEPEFILLLR